MLVRLAVVVVLALAATSAPSFAQTPRARPAAAAAAAPARAPSVAVERTPAWVVPAAEAQGVVLEPAAVHYRLLDAQTRIGDRGAERYVRVVRVPQQAAGLGPAAQVQVDFDPAYQTLVFHHADIVRDGVRTSRLDRARIQVLQRETQLERRVVDGRLTASLVFEDVRLGDQIDYAYSVRGSNPVFGGKVVETEWLIGSLGPVALAQYRLLAPAARRISHQAGSPDAQVATSERDGWRETVFRRQSVPAFRADVGAGPSVWLAHQVRVSEFGGWDEVARWGAALFQASGAAAPAVQAKAAELRAAAPDAAARVLAALRFVQADVRYFGTETGIHSYQPAAPERVLQQRFGDCKDKVGLLIALLRRLDVPAEPVLVSLSLRGRVEGLLASPAAFDHAVVAVTVDGRRHLLDATRGLQGGTLSQREAVGFGHGLVLAPGTTGLAPLPAPYDTVRVAVQDTYRVERFAEPATLESRISYRGELAEGLREALATRNRAEIEAQLAQAYGRMHPGLKPLAPMEVRDDREGDELTVVQRFAIPDLWRFPDKRQLSAGILQWSVAEAIRPPNEPTRRDAMLFAYPGIHRHTTRFEFGEDVNAAPGAQRFDDGDARIALRTSAEQGPRHSELATELRIAVDEVPAAEWAAHLDRVNRMAPRLGMTLSVSPLKAETVDGLRLKFQDIEERVRSGRLPVKTKVQVQAHARLVLLNAQIGDGRLPPALRAQVLTDRGIELDHLGRTDDAAASFAEALALAPEAVETLTASAVNAVARGEDAHAVELAGRALARQPGQAEALRVRALARYFAADLAGATGDVEEQLKLSGQARNGYPLLWRDLLARRAREDTVALWKRFADDQLPADWPRPVVDYARGKADAPALIKQARTPEQLTEAHYFVGERLLAEGDARGAALHFRKVLELGVTEYLEHGAARRRLLAIGAPA